MKRYKRLLFVCIAACSLCLGGCGDAMHELTLEEEALIDIEEVQSNIVRLKAEIAEVEAKMDAYLKELGL